MTESNDTRSYEELAEICQKLEAEAGRQLILQRDLIRAKDGIDAELMRFRAFQDYTANTLGTDSEEQFFSLTLEAIIAAFEYEVALFLLVSSENSTLEVVGNFGLDTAPDNLTFEPNWFITDEVLFAENDHTIIQAWADLELSQIIICPIFDQAEIFAGAVLAGITRSGTDFFDPIVAEQISAFGVMVRQAGAIWRNRQLTLEVIGKNRQLEIEFGQQLILQRDLVGAKDQIDAELMRFKAIQAYTAKALTMESETEFFTHTLESLAEAFEFEVALLLRLDEKGAFLTISGEFGFSEISGNLAYSENWFAGRESMIFDARSEMLIAWKELALNQVMVCPFLNKDDGLEGLILGGITADSADYYNPISEEQSPAFSVMARQAGALLINRELNGEIIRKNMRLASLTDSYSRFVPFEFLDLLGRSSIEEIDAGDNASLEVSVLFLDIRGFTAMTERMGPADTFIWLNEFLQQMEPLISAEKGFINQYQGDAIMALFPGPADAVLRCATQMIIATETYNKKQTELGDSAVRFGIGINSGHLILGAIGGENRLESNVVGDTANLASRIEGLTKIYGVPAIFTEFTQSRVNRLRGFLHRELDRVIVKGRKGTLSIFELLAPADNPVVRQKMGSLTIFSGALSAYRAGKFADAMNKFQKCIEICPEDGTAALFIDRCQHYIDSPPGGEWEGISVIGEK